MNKTGIIFVLAFFAGLIVLAFSTYVVNERHQALLFQFGEIKAVETKAGLNFKMPWQNVVYLEKRVLALDLNPQTVIVADEKRLVVDVVSRFRINDPLKFFQRVKSVDDASSRIEPILEASMRKVLGAELIPTVLSEKRTELMQSITEEVNTKTGDLGIEIVDVRIKRADLPEANTDAVVRRMIAERKKEAAEARALGKKTAEEIMAKADRDRIVILAEAQKQSEILRGEGEAVRNKVFADAFNRDPDFFEFYRSMQAYKKAMGANDTTLVLSPDSEFFRYFGDDMGGKKD